MMNLGQPERKRERVQKTGQFRMMCIAHFCGSRSRISAPRRHTATPTTAATTPERLIDRVLDEPQAPGSDRAPAG
jgi:hypothetical protein